MTPLRSPYETATRRLRGGLLFVALFSAAVNILMLTGPLFMMQVYDRVLSSGSIPTLQGLFVIVVVCFGALALFDFLRTRLLSRAAARLDSDVGQEAFGIWVRAGLAGRRDLGRPLADLAVVRGFLPSPAMLGLFDTPWIPLYLLVVFAVHPWLGYLALGGLFGVVVLAFLNQLLSKRHTAQAMIMDSAESFFIEQARRNADAIVPLGMAGRIGDVWRKRHEIGLAVAQIGSDRSEGLTAMSKGFRMLLQSALLGLGAYLALAQEISPGMIVAASIIAGRALAPVDQVIGQWRAIVRARESHRRLRTMFQSLPAARATINLPPPKGALTLSNVTKYHPDAKRAGDLPPVLDGVSFALEPGDAVGVIGPSASGKSTLARLLVGAWQADHGDVRLDGATLDQWPAEALGRYLGYLPQHVELMTGTIRDNIARFDPETEDEAVIAAARLAGVHEMILQLPDGYATELGYGSQSLSGGQIQRLGLARAVFGMPRLVVLDEPNSNLDAMGDEALSRAILALRQSGAAVVVMAHRPSAIAAVNKVLVLQAGRVADFGLKDEVLHRTTRPSTNREPKS